MRHVSNQKTSLEKSEMMKALSATQLAERMEGKMEGKVVVVVGGVVGGVGLAAASHSSSSGFGASAGSPGFISLCLSLLSSCLY